MNLPLRRIRSTCALAAIVLALCAPASASDADMKLDAARTAIASGDIAGALPVLTGLAEDGNAAAQAELGSVYVRGEGVAQDFAAAVHWFRKAAEQGDAAAQNSLAGFLAAGLGVTRDYSGALEWYRRAAEQGKPEHQFDLALMFDNGLGAEPDPTEAARWYASAAEQGLAEAQANLGLLYQQGRGVARDLAKARQLYSQAAAKGQARAQNNLGLMYTRGEGVPQDYETAAGWFSKAADQGLKPAMTNLGVMYENGFGVKRDEALAIDWYRRAGLQQAAFAETIIEPDGGLVYDSRLGPPLSGGWTMPRLDAAVGRGDPVAAFILAHLAANGIGVTTDYPAAARLYRQAAASGMAAAMLNLGLLHMRGLGVPQDFVLGYMWITLAAAAGQDGAAELRAAAAAQLTADQINEAQVLARRYWTGKGGNDDTIASTAQ